VKPAIFEYIRPQTLDEALAELAKDPDETKVLAGGQSLVPMMNFRLARPKRLIDINQIHGIDGITTGNGRVTIATRTRHLALQNLTMNTPLGSLLRIAATNVGHLPIRTRGTFGGSLAHCDAASEWCLVARLLDAEITLQSQARGVRTIRASEFFRSMFTTAMEPDEILTKVHLPELDDTYVTGLAEFARRAGDFAIVAATGAVRVLDGVVREARVCIGGVSEVPVRSTAAERVLLGQAWSPALLEQAAAAAAEEVDRPSDEHGDAAYRRDLVRALVVRAFESDRDF
jgi:carbon-monoxide dehydrogenase medium subunit